MDSLRLLKTQLLNFLTTESLQDTESQISQFQCRIVLSQPFQALSWLKAQNSYPQFYFHQRDQQKQLVTLGAIRSFHNLTESQQFINNNPFILVGGLQFYGTCHLWLPRLQLEIDKNYLYATLFIDSSLPFEQEKNAILAMLDNIEQQSPTLKVQQSITLCSQSANQSQWQQWVEKALAQINSGMFKKIVLANKTTFQALNNIDAKDLLAESECHNLHCYHFLLAENDQQTFIGSSPERLYSRQQKILMTEALAGTAPIGDTGEQTCQQANWLSNDKKNLYENWLVSQDIQINLEPYAQKLELGPLEIKAFRQVQHLYQPIYVQLKSKTEDRDCLSSIHPTAAVAGFPSSAAKTFLRQTENFERSWYAGALGYMSQQHAEFCVAIRSAFVEQNKIHVFAGAGIVEGSEPLLEWQEIERKAAGLLSLLAKS